MFVSSRLQYLVVEAPLPSDNKQQPHRRESQPSQAKPTNHGKRRWDDARSHNKHNKFILG